LREITDRLFMAAFSV